MDQMVIENRIMSVVVLEFFLTLMLVAYAIAPYYGNQEMYVGDGYVEINYGEIYGVSEDEKCLLQSK